MKRYRYTQSKRGNPRPKWFLVCQGRADITTYPDYCLLRQSDGSYVRCEIGDYVVLNDDGSLTTETNEGNK